MKEIVEANYWAQRKNQIETLDRLERAEDETPEGRQEYKRFMNADPKENTVPGGHVIKMFLPAGSRASAIGAAAKIPGKKPSIQQHEVLVDKGALFKITGFDVNNDDGAGPDSFNLMMELLSDTEGMEPTGNIAENLIQPNEDIAENLIQPNVGGDNNLLIDRGGGSLKVEGKKRNAAKKRLKANGGGIDILIDRGVEDLKLPAGNMDAPENLLEPIIGGGGNNLLIGNGDEDMKVGVDRRDAAQLRKWKEKVKRKKRKHRRGLHEIDAYS